MTLNSFISRYIIGIEKDPQETGYLAQHRLLDQIPQLMRDVIIPDYCALLTPEDEQGVDPSNGTTASVDDVLVNAWLGPNTTVSPLHHDPYHNLLAQVVGYKYIRLYDPCQSAFLYPMTDRKSNNR
jgi:lysine-specific demethylase 8